MKSQRFSSLLILIFLLFAIYSCKEKKEELIKKQEIERRNLEIEKFKGKYLDLVDSDSIKTWNAYTIEMNEKYRSKPIYIENFIIHDIYKNDEEFHLIIDMLSPSIYLDLIISSRTSELIRNKERFLNKDLKIIAVWDDIRKSSLTFETTDLGTIYLTPSDDFYAKGEILDILILDGE